ncbi:MAG: hypothetical protein GC203_12555 [Phenylobacterium sp.]|uniref:hypothetical protein n=1 Tax=Phenylobacterium sp. TaxID=1871053 RepID=UPI002600E771|nr:hypothetical protein [Phenylobacterium sp.]MBI1198687.1 hypothetical protein [Phenylobacterium sp.]
MVSVFRELPGIADLERRALLEPQLRSLVGAVTCPEFDQSALELFGTTSPDFQEGLGDDDWTGIYGDLPEDDREMVAYFATKGWVVSDGYGRPSYMLEPYLLLLCGHLAGKLPLNAQVSAARWGSNLAEEAKRFRPARS